MEGEAGDIITIALGLAELLEVGTSWRPAQRLQVCRER